MVRRLVPIAVTLASGIASVGGLASGVMGGMQMKRAQADMENNADRYELRHAEHLRNAQRTNETIQQFGQTQELSLHEVIFRMRDFLLRHEKQVRAQDHLILHGVETGTKRINHEAKLNTETETWINGAMRSAVAGFGTPMALRSLVSKVGKASTGTRISSLAGAAADRATIAFFGGGSLAAGGGGIRRGSKTLNFATAGPSLLVAGLTVKNEGAKAVTDADKHRTQISDAMARLDVRDELLRGVQKRAAELDEILTRLSQDASAALDVLESEPFRMDLHEEQLQKALILVKGVREVAEASVADEEGRFQEEAESLIFKYRDRHNEQKDV